MGFWNFEEFVKEDFGKDTEVDWEKIKEIKNEYCYSELIKHLTKLNILSKRADNHYGVLSKEEENLNPGKFYFVREKDAKKFMEAFDNSARVVQYPIKLAEKPKLETEEANSISNAPKSLEKEMQYENINWKEIRETNDEKRFRETIKSLIHTGILSSEQSKNYEIFSKDGRSLNPQGIYFVNEEEAKRYGESFDIPTTLLHHSLKFTEGNLEQRTGETSLKKEKMQKKKMSFKKKILLTTALLFGLVYGAEKTGIIKDKYFLENLPKYATFFLSREIIDPLNKQIPRSSEKKEKKKTAAEREMQKIYDAEADAKFQDLQLQYQKEEQIEQEAEIQRQRRADVENIRNHEIEQEEEAERIKEEKLQKEDETERLSSKLQELFRNREDCLEEIEIQKKSLSGQSLDLFYKGQINYYEEALKNTNNQINEIRDKHREAYDKGKEFYEQYKSHCGH